MVNPAMATQNKFSLCLTTVGLVFVAAGAALGSTASTLAGLMIVAVALRYRKNRASWEYPCFIALTIAICAWEVFAGTPLLLGGWIPLIFVYVLDNLDKRKQRPAGSTKEPMA